MKTIIIYESKHHGNTKKVCDRVAAECQVELIEAGSVGADFNWEDRFTSGTNVVVEESIRISTGRIMTWWALHRGSHIPSFTIQ